MGRVGGEAPSQKPNARAEHTKSLRDSAAEAYVALGAKTTFTNKLFRKTRDQRRERPHTPANAEQQNAELVLQEFARMDVQAVCDTDQHHQAGITLSPLDSTQIR